MVSSRSVDVICAPPAGIGSQLHAHSLSQDYQNQFTATVFDDGTRVHGIHGVSSPIGDLLAIHGGRNAKVRQ